MHENAIFSPITGGGGGGGGVRRVRPMLDMPLGSMKLIDGMSTYLYMQVYVDGIYKYVEIITYININRI